MCHSLHHQLALSQPQFDDNGLEVRVPNSTAAFQNNAISSSETHADSPKRCAAEADPKSSVSGSPTHKEHEREGKAHDGDDPPARPQGEGGGREVKRRDYRGQNEE